MILVYTHNNPALVGLARNMLDNAGIPVSVKNEFSAGGMTGGAYVDQEIWILNDNDLDKAKKILDEMTEEDDMDS